MDNLASLLAQYRGRRDKVLYRQWNGDGWRDFTAGEMLDLAARWQQAYRNLNFERGDRIALCMKNGAHWVAADMAALGMGLVVVPLYVIDNADNVAWCINHSDARLLVLENNRMMEALRSASAELPEVVCLQADLSSGVPTIDAWLPATQREFEVIDVAEDELATIVYTSGTTGRPKGVKLSHRNILGNVEATLKVVDLHDDDVLISLLPLSHMFERTCGYYLPLRRGLTVVYSRGIQQLAEDLAAVRPTILMAVPRVFERFLARIEQKLQESAVKRALFHRTVELGWRCHQGQASSLERVQYGLLKKIVAKPIMERLGGRMRLTVVGGAALEERIAKTFVGLGLTMLQGYGLTEASPVVAATRPADRDPVSVGRPLEGLETRISDNSELLVRGPSVMMGYWRNPEATAAMIDREGWLNTGDQVEIRNGLIYIRGRTKDIMVLSNGEKLPPETVEMAILEDPAFEQVMLIGEGRPFVILIAISQEQDEKRLIRRANEQLKDFPKWVRVRRVIVEKEPWTVEGGQLTPTMKIKRRVLLERYKDRIEKIYAEARAKG